MKTKWKICLFSILALIVMSCLVLVVWYSQCGIACTIINNSKFPMKDMVVHIRGTAKTISHLAPDQKYTFEFSPSIETDMRIVYIDTYSQTKKQGIIDIYLEKSNCGNITIDFQNNDNIKWDATIKTFYWSQGIKMQGSSQFKTIIDELTEPVSEK